MMELETRMTFFLINYIVVEFPQLYIIYDFRITNDWK